MLNIPPPPPGRPTKRQRTTLDGVPYIVRWAHNALTDSWTIDLTTVAPTEAEQVTILRGRKVFIGFDLLSGAPSDQRPAGALLAVSADGSVEAPGFDDLGRRVSLVYLEPGETLSG